MTHEPINFTSTMFETANEAFLFCQEYLRRTGHPGSRLLRGLDPINCPALGRIALRALREVQPSTSGETREYVDMALGAMTRALEDGPLSAVA